MAVVVGYVPTKEGAAALRRAAAEAAVRQTPLVVLDSAHAEGEDQAPDARAQLAELADQDVSYEVRTLGPTDDATDELLRIADEESADLLVIGLRRRSPVGKLILGANAQRILLDASCPVLAVKPSE
ncbi:universal stress protein [Flexivirga endophytica]|uniref:Universal stress protein n=1 Tax=Flexivirga endophytica TaxID=1849103 RepID=A0A916SU39_9MICO|nr:universal stress protein [Flexivirga endophytica]GGB18061.1 universal stress protein [Flexivirga endophytica]GHB37534.1 universal stress protein [Flexivirga endophytica]